MYYFKLKIYAGFRNTSKDTKRRLILTVILTDRYVTLGASSLSVGAALLMEVIRVLMSVKKKGTSFSHVKLCCAVRL